MRLSCDQSFTPRSSLRHFQLRRIPCLARTFSWQLFWSLGKIRCYCGISLHSRRVQVYIERLILNSSGKYCFLVSCIISPTSVVIGLVPQHFTLHWYGSSTAVWYRSLIDASQVTIHSQIRRHWRWSWTVNPVPRWLSCVYDHVLIVIVCKSYRTFIFHWRLPCFTEGTQAKADSSYLMSLCSEEWFDPSNTHIVRMDYDFFMIFSLRCNSMCRS